MSDEMIVARLLQLAAEASDPRARLAYLLHASIRPGLSEFLRKHVVSYGGPSLNDLPDIYMAVLASLTAELVENYMLNTGEHRQARRALVRFCKERFAQQLDDKLRGRPEHFDEIRRPNA